MSKEKKSSRSYRLKENKRKTAIISSIGLIFILGIMINYFNKNCIYNDKIAKNIYIENVDVSNMTKEEAIKVVDENISPRDINLLYEDKSYKISPNDIDLTYDTKNVIDKAYNYTKTDSYIENIKRYLSLRKDKKEFNISSNYNEAKLSEKIQNISKDINVDMVNAKVHISNYGGISTSPSTIGKELDIANTKDVILNNIKNKDYSDINLKVKTKEPHVKTEDAKSVNTLLGEFTTKFSTSLTGRVQNIRVAGNKSSDVLLMPGEEYSYNEYTGVRNKANGYKDAPVIINGKLEDGLGGGVCQVSSTLYNAVLESGLKLTSITNHSLLSTYVPIGRDAMVNDGGTDFRFKNQYNHPVYVKTVVGNGTLTCRIYGNDSDKKNIEIYVEAFKQNGLDASKTYRKYKDSNGNVIDTEYIHKSVYKKPNK